MSLIYTDYLSRDSDFADLIRESSNYSPGTLASFTIAKSTYIVADAFYGDGIGLFEIQSNGRLVVKDLFQYSSDLLGYERVSRSEIQLVETADGSTVAYFVPMKGTLEDEIVSLAINAKGEARLVDVMRADVTEASDIATMTVGDARFVFYSGEDVTSYEVASYRVSSNGELSAVDGIDPPGTGVFAGVAAASFGKKTYAIVTGGEEDESVSVYRATSDGAFSKVSEISTDDIVTQTTLDRIRDLETVKIGGKTFVFAKAGSDVTVMELSRKGELQIVAHEESDYGYDELGNAGTLETFTYDGQTYLVASGSDSSSSSGSGLSLMSVSKYGALTQLDSEAFKSLGGSVVTIGKKVFFVEAVNDDQALRSYRFVDDYDKIEGNRGNNTLAGTDEDDRLYGFGGKDKLLGGLGDDLLEGGKGNDKLEGGAGTDKLYGEGGNDTLYGDPTDSIFASGDDWLFGGLGNDKLFGGGSNDTLSGEQGKDRLFGGTGDDELSGGKGSDRLYGEDGDDRLSDGDGKDILYGGAGDDVFVLAPDGDLDRIADFEAGDDLIDLTAYGKGVDFLDLKIRASGDDVLIIAAKDQLLVSAEEGRLKIGDIGIDDFLFA